MAGSGLSRLVEQGRCDPRPINTGAYGYIVKNITPILKFRIGNRSALEWILNQHKEAEEPGDPREAWYLPVANYKHQMIDLLMRVPRSSVETHRAAWAWRKAKRQAARAIWP